MRRFLIILITVMLVSPLIYFVAGLLQPSEFEVKQTITIYAPASAIFEKVNNLRAWTEWIPWGMEQDSTLEYFYTGSLEGVGAIQEWHGQLSGDGKMEITESTSPRQIKYGVSYSSVFEMDGYVLIEEMPNACRVTWREHCQLGYSPTHRFMASYEKIRMDKAFEEGLQNLKKLVEAEAANLEPQEQ